jgi:hypothetical protein
MDFRFFLKNLAELYAIESNGAKLPCSSKIQDSLDVDFYHEDSRLKASLAYYFVDAIISRLLPFALTQYGLSKCAQGLAALEGEVHLYSPELMPPKDAPESAEYFDKLNGLAPVWAEERDNVKPLKAEKFNELAKTTGHLRSAIIALAGLERKLAIIQDQSINDANYESILNAEIDEKIYFNGEGDLLIESPTYWGTQPRPVDILKQTIDSASTKAAKKEMLKIFSSVICDLVDLQANYKHKDVVLSRFYYVMGIPINAMKAGVPSKESDLETLNNILTAVDKALAACPDRVAYKIERQLESARTLLKSLDVSAVSILEAADVFGDIASKITHASDDPEHIIEIFTAINAD